MDVKKYLMVNNYILVKKEVPVTTNKFIMPTEDNRGVCVNSTVEGDIGCTLYFGSNVCPLEIDGVKYLIMKAENVYLWVAKQGE